MPTYRPSMAAHTVFVPKKNKGYQRHVKPFGMVLDNMDTTSKFRLSMVNGRMYNEVNHNAIELRGNQFGYRQIEYNEGKKETFDPVDDSASAGMLDAYSSWTIIINGPRIGYVDNQSQALVASWRCKAETAMLLLRLNKISQPSKVRELVFHRCDMLGNDGVNAVSRLFNRLQTLQILKCREFTMHLTPDLLDIRCTQPNFQLLYTTEFPDVAAIRSEDHRGAVLASLYKWRNMKHPLLIENLVVNSRFRTFIGRYTRGKADDWYRFVVRDEDDDLAADKMLLEAYAGKTLVPGSNALTTRDIPCGFCFEFYPGICYPIRSFNSDHLQCFACRMDQGFFSRVPKGQLNYPVGIPNITNQNVRGIALAAMGVSPDTYPYVKAPYNQKFNSVCPFSLNRIRPRHPTGEKCSLRETRVRLFCICG